MLNSVSDPVRRRLSAEDRRRQLVGIGLSRIVDTPIQDLSLDAVAAEAGISRGLLFHYFPTKTDFYLACIAAAGRRILRNTAPSSDDPGPEQVRSMLVAMIEQIDRRRAFYLTLVHGSGVADPRVSEVYDSVRSVSTDRVMAALGLDAAAYDLVHAWWAYVEDRALSWSAEPADGRTTSLEDLVAHCERVLALLGGTGSGQPTWSTAGPAGTS
ncbi:TetR/AcrR family transcriptional regulator [Nocardioides currus]|uniref:TetR/AcrR family transcriptional regulator n=1 Tax=Nocardioides currus TaxID=2133958 RepID=A0A2R7YW26_9ACTN|nr:TetR/AcrR family transcriptional regulator [Nocardioides currus]PUA80256.1 TetR/AcrR family transcriptional regulator [Nocardioides currus]